ncbi:hypothetical protein [Galbibacter pacificus]|uniref:Uncharacterized protein n=1 Tax=Galbibacter pacificus TaxID=2996052 RepID=A0ABT6FRN4_9FLAO|nr:hypothetical protein [Galbibacter pacificus]MDG3582948.1 hypothetical protein [Galbibacter pacificus]MDG3585933.1 hypothetical protein [Galbibacter pacificus]
MANKHQELNKTFYILIDEAQFTRDILGSGITQIGRANYGQRGMYFQAFTGISTGLERIGKLCLLLDYYIQHNGTFPDDKYLKNEIGHDLIKIYEKSKLIIDRNEIEFSFQNGVIDPIQIEILKILSKFAKGDRYSNIDFLVNSKYQSDPIRNWHEKIDKELYKKRVSKQKKEKIEFNAKIIGKLLDPVSSVRHYSESREEINNMESASFLTGMMESIAKYRQLYILQIVRYWVEVIRSLQSKARKLGYNDIPWFTEVFAIFNNKDSYFLTRKTYETD